MKTAVATPDPDRRRFVVTPEVRALVGWAVNAARDPNTHPAVRTNLNLAFDALCTLGTPGINPGYRAGVSKAVVEAANDGADLWNGLYQAARNVRPEVQ